MKVASLDLIRRLRRMRRSAWALLLAVLAALAIVAVNEAAYERSDGSDALDSWRIGVSAMAALSLLALLLSLRHTLKVDRLQREHAQAMLAERDRLALEATRSTADLVDLARHLQTAGEDERSRLARELHDELGALLTAAKLDAARLERAIGVMSPEVQHRLQHLNASINRGIELKRRIIEDLHPSALGNLGLQAALQNLAQDHAGRSGVRLTTALQPVQLTGSAQITVYRLVQEALANSARHARASAITMALHDDDDGPRRGARIVVSDNGIGFDTSRQRGTLHGLLGLRYRVEAEGGVMRVQAAPGSGTRIEAWLPRGPDLPGPVQHG